MAPELYKNYDTRTTQILDPRFTQKIWHSFFDSVGQIYDYS